LPTSTSSPSTLRISTHRLSNKVKEITTVISVRESAELVNTLMNLDSIFEDSGKSSTTKKYTMSILDRFLKIVISGMSVIIIILLIAIFKRVGEKIRSYQF